MFYFFQFCPVYLTFLDSWQLESPCYDCLWHDGKGSWHRKFFSAYHCLLDLWNYIDCFAQSGEAFTIKGNKRTDTNRHKNTYTNRNTKSLRKQGIQIQKTMSHNFQFLLPLKITFMCFCDFCRYEHVYTYKKKGFQNILERKLCNCFRQLLFIY